MTNYYHSCSLSHIIMHFTPIIVNGIMVSNETIHISNNIIDLIIWALLKINRLIDYWNEIIFWFYIRNINLFWLYTIQYYIIWIYTCIDKDQYWVNHFDTYFYTYIYIRNKQYYDELYIFIWIKTTVNKNELHNCIYRNINTKWMSHLIYFLI